MKKFLFIALSLIAFSTVSQAKVNWGIRGGYNITTMSFNQDVLSSKNQTGFYVGPTVKIGLVLGLGLDASVLYDQRKSDCYVESGVTNKEETLTRKTIAVPLNLRYSIGLGSVANVFVFAGPQFDFNLSKDIKETNFEYSWSTSTFSANVGFGLTLAEHFEVRANYNIPCGDSGKFSLNNAINSAADGIKSKTGAWQIGAAFYF